MPAQPVILDTNVFVAAGFKPAGSSAAIIDAVRNRRLPMAWSEATRAETQSVLRRIPPLGWERFSDLFDPAGEYCGAIDLTPFEMVADPQDRKFAALAAATGGILVSSDGHFLSCRDELPIPVFTPREFAEHMALGPA
jgi:predicted nucleic acid-binding protein